MSDESSPLLCGQCYAPVEGRTEVDGSHKVRCPDCGQEDTFESAAREAAEHTVQKVFKSAFRGLGSSGAVKVNGLPERSYRFITEDD